MPKAPPPPANPAEPSYVGDEYWGIGGAYQVDPITGRRTPITEVEQVTTPAQPDTTTEA